MSISSVFRYSLSILAYRARRAIGARAAVASLIVLSLTGCASGLSVVETWEGNPQGADQAAILKAPEAIIVMRVNGREMTNFLMDDLALDYALLPGTNEVVFRYKTIWAKSGVVENGEPKVHVITSEPQVVRFDARAGETYRFVFDKPGSREEAERIMPDFSARIVSSSGEAVTSSMAWEPVPASVAARTPLPEPGPDPVAGNQDDGDDETAALDRLKAIWQTATDEEKKAFLRWAFE